MRILLAVMLLAGPCAREPESPVAAAPQRVAIDGYDGDVMEPFLSRDGHTLFFNNRNDPPEKTDLHWAERLDDLHFRYRGRIGGANSPALDGVATMDAGGRLCFVSTRSYAATLATLYCGQWNGVDMSGVALQGKAAVLIPGRVMFDIELNARGDYAIVSDGTFTGGPVPAAADLRLARRTPEDALALDPGADRLFAAVNTPALEYAAGLSADGLTFCFTRIDGGQPSLWIAMRGDEQAPFGTPQRILAATGFVEACTFAADGAIYYHRLDAGRFSLWRLAR